MTNFELNTVRLLSWRGRPLNLIKLKDELLLQLLYLVKFMNKAMPAPKCAPTERLMRTERKSGGNQDTYPFSVVHPSN